MMLLFLGHFTDALRGRHRVGEVRKAIGASENFDGSAFGVGAVEDVPTRTQLCQKGCDLRVVERRNTAAARDARARREFAHCVVFRGCPAVLSKGTGVLWARIARIIPLIAGVFTRDAK